MLTVPLAAVSAASPFNSAISAEDGAKRAETVDVFAALLGMQISVAAGDSKPEPAIARPALPKGGKALPVTVETEPAAGEPASPDLPATDDPAPSSQPEMLALPGSVFSLIAHATNTPFAAQAVVVQTAPSVPLAPEGAQPATLAIVQPKNDAQVPQPELQVAAVANKPDAATGSTATPDNDNADKPSPKRPNAAPQLSLPAQAAARAVLIHGTDPVLNVDPIKPAPVLPEQAAAQATVALAARGNPERSARAEQPAAPVALPTDAVVPSPLPPMQFHQLKKLLAEPVSSADLPPALAIAPGDSDPLATPQGMVPAPAMPPAPAPARHDFAAMIDRLIEARDMAGAQPVAMSLRHDDFGTVSLNFRSADDGLTVTMASPDPEFARAVSAAAASGAASQGDPTRNGGESASPRQHSGGSASENSTGQSRAGSHDAGRDGSRQRRDQSPPQRATPREQTRGGIFA